MRKSMKNKKFRLPVNYQEILISQEIELSNGVTLEILRKLVYLYTLGMDYYNLSGKPSLEKFYNDKLIALLTRNDVANILDRNQIDLSSNDDLNLFNEGDSNLNGKGGYSVLFHENNIEQDPASKKAVINTNGNESAQTAPSTLRKTTRNTDFNKRGREMRMKQKIMNQVNVVDVKLAKMKELISQSIASQMSSFEEKRKLRRYRKLGRSLLESPNREEDQMERGRCVIGHQDSDQSHSFKREGSICLNEMNKEIEDYVHKNKCEMLKVLNELQKGFQLEITKSELNNSADIKNSLRDDIQSELDNLRDQFEEQERIEIEKIKEKFQNKSSLCLT